MTHFFLRCTIWAFLLLFFAQNGIAQPNYLQNFSPKGAGGGGYMYSPSISPHNPDDIFLTCDMGGVYRSQNGGQTWQMQPSQSLVSTVKGKIQFTSNPNLLFVCRRSTTNFNDPLFRGELAKSTNGGQSWQSMSDPTESGVHRLEVDPASTQRLILNEYNRLFFSGNGGNSWTEVYHPAEDQMWLGGVFWDGVNIYVGTQKGLLVSHDNGQNFAIEAHSGLPAGVGIMHLSGAKAGNTTRLFAITALADEMYAWLEPLDLRNSIQGFHRLNYSANAAWTSARGNIPNNVRITWADLALNNTQTVWAAAEDGGLPLIYKSTNSGQSWTNTFLAAENQNVSTGWGGDYGAFSYLWSGAALGFDVSNVDPNQVISTDGFGHITTDGGASWRATYVHPDYQNPAGSPTPVNKFYQSAGLDVTTGHQMIWLNDTEILSANTDIGLTYSADAGETWTFARNTFYPWGTLANPNWYRIVQRPDNQDLYAALGEINDIYLGYRITDEQVAGGGMVVRSSNQGQSWDTIYNFGHPVVWLELDKNNPNRMFASVVDFEEGGIFRSNDGGNTWTKLNLPARTQGHPYNIISLNDGGLVVTFSARALSDGQTLTESSGVFYSPDGGTSWLDRTAPAMRFYTKDIVVDPHDPTQNTWYSTVWGRFTVFQGPNNAGNGGLYKTTNRGQNWTRVFAAEAAESLTIHPQKPDLAYLSVENGALYYTENLNAAQPSFSTDPSFPFWRPKRIFFKPNNPAEIWVTTMGGGLWKAQSSPSGVLNYAPSSEDMVNPERGFMRFTETHSNAYSALTANELASWREQGDPGGGANYTVASSLVYRGFYLENFKNGAISNAYLNLMQQDFDAARQAGVKLVVRFAYTQKDTPPYGDVAKSRVLQHIAQLKPYLLANSDVIAVLQMGFIGAWGEGYYTDHFGFGNLTAQNWTDRTEVLNALLEALPADRSVQVRVPQMKQKAVYGPMASPNSAALTQAEAWQNTPKARIGFVNDCFLADETDFGTYINYDFNASGCDTCIFKPYTSNDSKYVPMGGETCSDTLYPYNNCNSEPGGHAQDEMARMHFSYLNSGWNNAVNNDWVDGGCMDEIKQRLGYRLELIQGQFPAEARPGQTISVKIDLRNKGFAAPFNARKVRLLLRNTASSNIWQVELNEDPRSWLPGNQTYTLEHSFCLPPDLPQGNYELLLHLADPYPALSNRPEYAIRLANENTWEAATGYNRLLHQISVNNTANTADCNGETCFQALNLTAPTANFTASLNSGCAPLTVTFSNETADCWDYLWTFPGAAPNGSNLPQPTVTYADAGVFEVQLAVSNAAGTSTELKTGFVTVSALPTPDFSFSSTGLSATFTNTSTDATQFSWDFGDGSALSSALNPVHDFPGPGNYPVRLTATNNCGQKTLQIQVLVQCLANTIQISSQSDPVFCPGGFVTLTGPTGFETYAWLQNGMPLTGASSATLDANLPGLYELLVTDAQNCTASSNAILVQEIPGATANFQASINGLSVNFTNQSTGAGAYSWDFGDGSMGSTEANPQHNFPGPGTYSVTLTAINDVCGAVTLSQTFTLECLDWGGAIASDSGTKICEGQSLELSVLNGSFASYRWYRDGVEISGANSGSLEVSLPGVYKVLVGDGAGCSSFSNEVEVEVWPLPVVAIQPPGPIVIPFGQTINLSAGMGFATWIWSTGETTPSITVADCGIYTVEVVDQNGCSATALPVTVAVSPVVVFNNGTLSSSPADSYQWLLNGTPISGANEQTFVPTVSGNYAVQTSCPGTLSILSNTVSVVIVGVSALNLGQITLYPNPISEQQPELFLALQGIDPEAFTLVLSDVTGREWLRKTSDYFVERTSLHTEGIPAGTYFLRVLQAGKIRGVGVVIKI